MGNRYQEEFPVDPNLVQEQPKREDTSSVPNLPAEQSIELEEDDNFQKIVNSIIENWSTSSSLQIDLLDISVIYKETADELGEAISNLSATFIGEKDLEPSMTVTEADHRAKQAFGGKIERLRGKLESLSLLHKTIMHRVGSLAVLKD